MARRKRGGPLLGHGAAIVVGTLGVAAVLGAPWREPASQPEIDPSEPFEADLAADASRPNPPEAEVETEAEADDELVAATRVDPPPIAGEACVAAWRAVAEFEGLIPQGGLVLGGGLRRPGAAQRRWDRYGCFAADVDGGRYYLEARYGGGDVWSAEAWTVEFLCDETGPLGEQGERAAARCPVMSAEPG